MVALVGVGVVAGIAGFLLGRERPPVSEQRVASPVATPVPTPGGQGRGVRGGLVNQEQQARALIENLYQALSAKDWAAAATAYTPAMQAQFDPSFFAQFERVTVDDLRLVEQTPDRLEFIGRNTYVYPNGDTQEEERSYTVVWSGGGPLIADSRFLRVTKPRR